MGCQRHPQRKVSRQPITREKRTSWHLERVLTKTVTVLVLSSYHSTDVLFSKQNNHSGPVRGLHFNPFQQNLLSSASSNGEVILATFIMTSGGLC